MSQDYVKEKALEAIEAASDDFADLAEEVMGNDDFDVDGVS